MATSPTYPLLPYSQLVFDMLKTNPEVYTSRSVLKLKKSEVDIERLKQAIEQTICNHPIFSMQVADDGMQYYEPRADVLHGQYYSVDFREDEDSIYMDIRGNRILGDAQSGLIAAEDILRAYVGLPLQQDAYLEYLEHVEELKSSPHYVANRSWLETEYGNLSCSVRPITDAPITENDIPIEGTLLEDYGDIHNALLTFGDKYLLSLTAVFSLASALAIMEYNGTEEAALTWAYDGREKEEEQRIYGSLHRDVPFKINIQHPITNFKSDLIRETRRQFRKGIAHSSYPFTLTQPHTDIWNYALNVLVQPSPLEILSKFPFTFEVIEDNGPHVAYSLLDVEILDGEKLFVNYRYSATHYKKSSIRRFAALVRKYAEWLLEE